MYHSSSEERTSPFKHASQGQRRGLLKQTTSSETRPRTSRQISPQHAASDRGVGRDEKTLGLPPPPHQAEIKAALDLLCILPHKLGHVRNVGLHTHTVREGRKKAQDRHARTHTTSSSTPHTEMGRETSPNPACTRIRLQTQMEPIRATHSQPARAWAKLCTPDHKTRELSEEKGAHGLSALEDLVPALRGDFGVAGCRRVHCVETRIQQTTKHALKSPMEYAFMNMVYSRNDRPAISIRE